MKAPARSTDLVVLVNGFPRLSETFVLQELLELERRGLSLHVFALRRPDLAEPFRMYLRGIDLGQTTGARR